MNNKNNNDNNHEKPLSSYDKQKAKAKKYKAIAIVTGTTLVVGGAVTGIVLGTQLYKKPSVKTIEPINHVYDIEEKKNDQMNQFNTKVDSQQHLDHPIKAKLKKMMGEHVRKAENHQHLANLKNEEQKMIDEALSYQALRAAALTLSKVELVEGAIKPTAAVWPGDLPPIDYESTTIFDNAETIKKGFVEIQMWIEKVGKYNDMIEETNAEYVRALGYKTQVSYDALKTARMIEHFTTNVLSAGHGVNTREVSTLRQEVEKMSRDLLKTAKMPLKQIDMDALTTKLDEAKQNLNSLKAIVAKAKISTLDAVQGTVIPNGFFKGQDFSNIGDMEFVIPERFTEIGVSAFEDAILPEKFRLPGNIVKIQANAFRSTDFSRVKNWQWTIRQRVSPDIEYFAFSGAILPEGFVIPEGIEKIHRWMFRNAKFPASFKLSNSVRMIAAEAFENANMEKCTEFKWTRTLENVEAFAFKHTLLPKDFSFEEGVTKIPAEAFTKAYINGMRFPASLKTIERHAFMDAEISGDFVIPPTITKLESAVFKNADLTMINDFAWPRHLTSIPASTFERAKLKANFRIDGVREIGIAAFSHATMPEFQIPESVRIIRSRAFEWTKQGLTFRLPATLQIIESEVLKGADLRETIGFLWPSSIAKIEKGMFKHAKLPRGFVIESGVTSIGASVFEGAVFSSKFTMPSSLITVGDFDPAANQNHGLFMLADLSNGFEWQPAATARVYWDHIFYGAILPNGFRLPQSVTRLDSQMFQHAKLPRGFEVPVTVTIIDGHALYEVSMPEGCKWVDIATGAALPMEQQRDPQVSGIRIDVPTLAS